MADSTNILLAAGCVILVTWYGAKRWGEARSTLGHQPEQREDQSSSRHAIAALQAEFRDRSSLDPASFAGGKVACIDCGMEYPAGVMYCGCGGETEEYDEGDDLMAAGFELNSPETAKASLSQESLICVHIAENHWVASLIRSYLEHHEIPCAIGGNSSSSPYSFNVGPMSEVRILVYEEHRDKAKGLLRKLASN